MAEVKKPVFQMIRNMMKRFQPDQGNDAYQFFNLLYNDWNARLYGFVFKFVKSRSLANDIVQETFMRVWINIDKIDPRQSIRSYLFTISYRLILNEFRRQASHPLMEDFMITVNHGKSDESRFDLMYDFDTFLKYFRKAKMQLSNRQRQIVELNKEQNIPVDLIAREIGISEQSVRNQLSAALKILRENFTKTRL